MTLQAFTLSTSEIAFQYQKNRTEWEKTEISRLGIGFENLIEKSLIEQQARTGETIPNDHEQYISFNLINFINLCIKTISLMLVLHNTHFSLLKSNIVKVK
jgi:hypothetical protein